MLFVISCVFALIGFAFSFFGVTVNNFTRRPQEVKNLKVLMLLSFSAALALAYLENRQIDKKNDLQFNIIKSSKKKIDSLNRQLDVAKKSIEDTVKACSENNLNQTALAEAHITDAVAKGIQIGIAEARANKNEIKRTIIDSSDRVVPDLHICSDNDQFYKDNKDTSKATVFIGLMNSGAGRAIDIEVPCASIFAINPGYRLFGEKYHTYLQQEDLTNKGKWEISGHKGKGRTLNMGFFKQEAYSEVYFRLKVSYKDYSHRHFSFTQTWVYTPANEKFREYTGGIKDLDKQLREIDTPDVHYIIPPPTKSH